MKIDDGLVQRISDALHRAWRGRVIATSAEQLAQVSSKSKLADALGIARVTLCQYCRLPDSPPVRNGYYYVADWRKFITKKRSMMETSEKQQLQLELLKTKLQREQHCLGEAQNATGKTCRRAID